MPFKQKSLQSAASFALNTALSAALCVCCIGTLTPGVAQGVSPGSAAGTLRLIAAPGLDTGRYEAGVELTMAAGSHTYWKTPGDAGVPPVFAFSGSENVAEATVSFPAPTRISEEGFDAFGYTDKVVFPVAVIPGDAGQPVKLHIDVTYAVCSKICVPGHGEATLILRPKEPGVDGGAVVAALAQVPTPASRDERSQLTITPDPDASKPKWMLTWSAAAPVVDIFPDAPEGYLFDTRKLAANRWSLTASQALSSGSPVKVPVQLVLKRENGSVSLTETLDVKPTSR